MSGCKKSPLLSLTVFLLMGHTALAAAPAKSALDPNFCQQLVKHVPDADVAYQAGVDVRGKPVVPADLEDTNDFTLPQEITIPLTVDLMSFLNLDTTALPASAMKRNDIQLGTLTVRGDKAYYNGNPLSGAQQDNLAVLCMRPRP